MRTLHVTFYLLVLLFPVSLLQAAEPAADPLGLLLTWQRDPSTTMTIDWHTHEEDSHSSLHYRPRASEAAWIQVSAQVHAFPYSERRIHRVELEGLEADTDYEFRLGDYTRVRHFRTMPLDTVSRPVTFISGGDVRHDVHWTEQTSRQMMIYEPDFVLWGGDLAYANGNPALVERWYELLDASMHALVTPSGRNVPVLAAIGNHEVKGGYYHNNEHALREGLPTYSQDNASRAAIAPYFFSLFAFPGQPGYGVMDFGNYLSILFLDTDHSNPIDGEQRDWLATTLAARQHVSHVFPIYHVGAFPSVRNAEGATHRRVREHWLPLFDESNVRVAFENHDHVYKRTWPIRHGEVDQGGIVYFGDGAWGTETRELGRDHNEHAWYLERAAAQRHAIVVTLQGGHQSFRVINEHGLLIDEYPRMSLPETGDFLAPRWQP